MTFFVVKCIYLISHLQDSQEVSYILVGCQLFVNFSCPSTDDPCNVYSYTHEHHVIPIRCISLVGIAKNILMADTLYY